MAMVDPTDLSAYDEIAHALKWDIEIAVVMEKPLLDTVDRIYRRTEEISDLARDVIQRFLARAGKKTPR